MDGNGDTSMAGPVLDVSGLNCPLPVLKARKRMRELAPGSVLTVRATDPMARIDIPHFCNVSGFQLLDSTADGATLVFRILKPAG